VLSRRGDDALPTLIVRAEEQYVNLWARTSSEAACHKQQQNHRAQQAEAHAQPETPASVTRPSRKSCGEQQNVNHEKNGFAAEAEFAMELALRPAADSFVPTPTPLTWLVVQPARRSDRPLISRGWATPMRARSVGATSASRPSTKGAGLSLIKMTGTLLVVCAV
jgi:hypothetical protein